MLTTQSADGACVMPVLGHIGDDRYPSESSMKIPSDLNTRVRELESLVDKLNADVSVLKRVICKIANNLDAEEGRLLAIDTTASWSNGQDSTL